MVQITVNKYRSHKDIEKMTAILRIRRIDTETRVVFFYVQIERSDSTPDVSYKLKESVVNYKCN